MKMCITSYSTLSTMDLMPSTTNQDDYDAISDTVRRFCAERLYELERSLRPLVDGSFGEVVPGHLTGYLTVLRDLARLYEANKRPHEAQATIPVAKVQEMLAGMEAEFEVRLLVAVSEAETRARMEAASGQQLGIEAAKAAVLTRLQQLEGRG
jgi:hypothetical protein